MNKVTKLAVVVCSVMILAGAALGTYTVLRIGDFAQQIQQERVNSTLRSCQELNDRHDRTIAALDALRPTREGREATKKLIDALVPRRNCEERVKQVVPNPLP